MRSCAGWGQKCPADETYPNCVNGLPYLRDKDSLPTDSVQFALTETRSSILDTTERLRQSHYRLQQAIAVLSSAGDDSRPSSRVLDRKIAARLSRRCPRPGEARIMSDSYVSSMGSAFTETGYSPTADRDADRKLARLRTLPELVDG